jgi:hypothetical protein
MANVVNYQRHFQHDDWVDNEDVVQADGERGFNPKFHALETEFDNVAAAFGQANTAFSGILRLAVGAPPNQLMLTAAGSPGASSGLIDIGQPYPKSAIEQVFFPAIEFTGASANIQYVILYTSLPGNQRQAHVQFFNMSATPATFTFSISTLATQP